MEVSAEEITLRVGSRWLRFTSDTLQHDDEAAASFALNENGTVSIADRSEQEMDLAAEQFAREMMQEPQ